MTKDEALSYLKFEDWIAKRDDQRSDWVVVARCSEDPVDGPMTMSALIPHGEAHRESLFRDVAWGFRPDELGKPGYVGWEDEMEYREDLATTEEAPYRAFTIYRSFPVIYPTYFELRQEFVMYHDAHYEASREEWVSLTAAREDRVIARRLSEGSVSGIEVDVDSLRDFLTTGPWSLARHHDHRRAVPRVDVLKNGERLEEPLREASRVYDVSVMLGPFREITQSMLRGKDIIEPYSGVPRHQRWWDRDRRDYGEFIVGLDDCGEPVECTCNERELPAEMPNGDTIDRLTPVYFNSAVLDKYRRDPARYGGAPGVAGLWHISHSINSEGLVMVWLLDLGRIPYSEQMHWRSHNVSPAGGVPKDRLDRDFMVQPVDPQDPASQFALSYRRVSEASREALGYDLFLAPSSDDEHILTQVTWPILNTPSAIDEQLLSLGKLLCDSINVGGISNSTGLSIGREGIKGSIDLLAAALRSWGCDEKGADAIVAPLHTVWHLRSTASAHRRGAKLDKSLQKAGLDGLLHDEVHTRVLGEVTASLKRLMTFLSEECGVNTGSDSQD